MNFGAPDWIITIVYLTGSVALVIRGHSIADSLRGPWPAVKQEKWLLTDQFQNFPIA
jgi:hypothetical protein